MKLLLLFILIALSLFLTACKTPSSTTSTTVTSLTPTLSDAVLVAQVGIEYEVLAKTKKVALADYSTIASNAVKSYTKSHGIPDNANVDDLLAMANTAVQLYALAKP